MACDVFVEKDVADSGIAFLQGRGYGIIRETALDQGVAPGEAARCDAVLATGGGCDSRLFADSPRLKVIALCHGRSPGIDLAAADRAGIQVVNAPQANADAVAEFALCVMLAHAKRLCRIDRSVRAQSRPVPGAARELAGCSLGLIGLSPAGRSLGQKAAEALGMQVMAYESGMGSDWPHACIARASALDEVLENSDFLSFHPSAPPGAGGVFGAAHFSKMRGNACLINCIHPEIIDYDDLCAALRDHWIGGVAICVPDGSNIPRGLHAMDNVLLFPASAAETPETRERASLHAAMGIDEVLSGKDPTWPVNNLKVSRYRNLYEMDAYW